jgi:hypothetical protein
VLLDECVPRQLKRDLIGHDVEAVVDIGWSSKRNGELLQLMLAQKFDVLLTVDQNLEFQQNVRTSRHYQMIGFRLLITVSRVRAPEGPPLSNSLHDVLSLRRAGLEFQQPGRQTV